MVQPCPWHSVSHVLVRDMRGEQLVPTRAQRVGAPYPGCSAAFRALRTRHGEGSMVGLRWVSPRGAWLSATGSGRRVSPCSWGQGSHPGNWQTPACGSRPLGVSFHHTPHPTDALTGRAGTCTHGPRGAMSRGKRTREHVTALETLRLSPLGLQRDVGSVDHNMVGSHPVSTTKGLVKQLPRPRATVRDAFYFG